MRKIELKIGGKELAKVIYFYGFSELNENKIVCPFHDDINPSMQVDFEEGKWYCYGCGLAGDALTFVMNVEKGLDDLHACMKFIKILKSKKSREIKSRHIATKTRVENAHALDMAHDYFYGLKTVDWVTEDLEIKSYMKDRGFKAITLNKAKAKYTYKSNYPIIFPMLDNGVFKGWVCRTNVKAIEKKRKYLYNEGFSRATTLVGDYKGPKPVVVVEGYMDWLKMRQFGLTRVVAILGWKMTDNQVAKLKEQGITTVISALDTDECGCKGTRYLERFFKVIRFQYPQGIKDAGDLSQQAFNKAYNKTIRLWRKNK